MSAKKRDSDSNLVATLAAITFMFIVLGIVANVVVLLRGNVEISFPEPGSAASRIVTAIAMVTVVSMFWFWFRMLADYLRNRTPNGSFAWGFALFFFSVGAALVYYWRIWRPRHA